MELSRVLEVSDEVLRMAEKVPCGSCLGQGRSLHHKCSRCNDTGFVKIIPVTAEVIVPSDAVHAWEVMTL